MNPKPYQSLFLCVPPQSSSSRLLVILALIFITTASAQRVEVGGIVGWSPSPSLQPSRVEPDGPLSFGFPYQSNSGIFVGGLTFGVQLQPRLYLSLDMLHKPLEYQFLSTGVGSGMVQGSTTRVAAWQFPLLARYHLTSGSVQPFLEGGPSFRTAARSSVVHPSGYGFTAGAGVQFPFRDVAIAPRLRYTRWGADPLLTQLRARQDQLELLVGVTFRGDEQAKPLGRRFSLGGTIGTYLGNQTASSLVESVNPADGGTSRVFSELNARRLLVGPVFQYHITSRVSAEVNVLLRSYQATQTINHEIPAAGFVGIQRDRGVGPYTRWEVPILGRYHFAEDGVRPFLAAGVSLREGNQHTVAIGSRYGFTTGAGVELPWKVLRFSPQLRYTRWGTGPDGIPGRGPLPRDEVHLLLSTTF